MNKSIRPGKPMLDTKGKPIHAHGGGVFVDGDVFYLYGENKEKSVKGADIYHWGVRAYRSKDLYNWEDCGLLIPPDIQDKYSPLHPSSSMDRPHILFNRKTGKYVCWIKIVGRNKLQTLTIMQADSFFGPYKMVKNNYLPFDMSAGDFDLDVNESDGKAYYFFENIHTDIVSCALSDDFLSVTEPYQKHFYHALPPVAREAPVHFVRNGKHYLFTSGTTGYRPNPSEAAVSDNIMGPYNNLGNLHPADNTLTSYGCQISEVLCVPGTDLYIAIGDRWLPRIKMAHFYLWQYTLGLHMIAKLQGLEKTQQMLREEKPEPIKRKRVKNFNTACSGYVWLPIRFENEKPVIDWHDEWRIEDFV